jgi:hypothetical protein
MNFKNINIGKKLLGSFIAIALLFAMVIAYQINSMSTLGKLQDESARRAADAVAISDILNRLISVYPIVADAIINQDMAEAKTEFAAAVAQAEKDMTAVKSMADTDVEHRAADEFSKGYHAYLDVFKQELLPVLEAREDMARRAMDMAEIKDIQARVNGMYAIFADAVINQKLDRSIRDFEDAKRQALADITKVDKLVDTDAERAKAVEFEHAYF